MSGFAYNRFKSNMEILEKLKEYLEEHPTQRFGQALRNLGIVVDRKDNATDFPVWENHFNEEPQLMLARMGRKNG